MAEPTLSLTFTDFVTRVAEYLGVNSVDAGGVAAPPTNASDLDLCQRLVNDGYRRFLMSNPNWQFMRPLTSITFDPTGVSSACVGSDPSRYFMPVGFWGDVLGPWTYDTATNLVGPTMVADGRLRELRAGYNTTGYPSVVAVSEVAASDASSGKRWQAMFWPTPGLIATLNVRVKLMPDKMSTNSATSIAGCQFDAVVLAAAIAAAELQRDDIIGVREQAYLSELAAAKRIDGAAAPRTVGFMRDTSDVGRPTSVRYRGVDTYNNVPI